MNSLAENGERRPEVWSFGITGFLPVEGIRDFQEVGNYLLSLVGDHPHLASPMMGGIVDWLQGSDSVVPTGGPDENLLLLLWKLTWTASLQDDD
jgi:hypothetical protein